MNSDEHKPAGETWVDPFYLVPPDYYDPVIEHYKKELDLTLLERNSRLSYEERWLRFQEFLDSRAAWKHAEIVEDAKPEE